MNTNATKFKSPPELNDLQKEIIESFGELEKLQKTKHELQDILEEKLKRIQENIDKVQKIKGK